jgi:hypothetical protein
MDEPRSVHGHKNTHLLCGKMKEKTKHSSDLDGWEDNIKLMWSEVICIRTMAVCGHNHKFLCLTLGRKFLE